MTILYRIRWFPPIKRRDGRRGKGGWVLERVWRQL